MKQIRIHQRNHDTLALLVNGIAESAKLTDASRKRYRRAMTKIVPSGLTAVGNRWKRQAIKRLGEEPLQFEVGEKVRVNYYAPASPSGCSPALQVGIVTIKAIQAVKMVSDPLYPVIVRVDGREASAEALAYHEGLLHSDQLKDLYVPVEGTTFEGQIIHW